MLLLLADSVDVDQALLDKRHVMVGIGVLCPAATLTWEHHLLVGVVLSSELPSERRVSMALGLVNRWLRLPLVLQQRVFDLELLKFLLQFVKPLVLFALRLVELFGVCLLNPDGKRQTALFDGGVILFLLLLDFEVLAACVAESIDFDVLALVLAAVNLVNDVFDSHVVLEALPVHH